MSHIPKKNEKIVIFHILLCLYTLWHTTLANNLYSVNLKKELQTCDCSLIFTFHRILVAFSALITISPCNELRQNDLKIHFVLIYPGKKKYVF